MKIKLFNFSLMNVNFVCWSFNDFIFLISTHQCFQLQNLVCDYSLLQLHKWFNIATIIFLTLLHMYKHIYAHTRKHIQINHTTIYVFLYIHKCTCTTSCLLIGLMCLWHFDSRMPRPEDIAWHKTQWKPLKCSMKAQWKNVIHDRM
jgi:hypothetical protein